MKHTPTPWKLVNHELRGATLYSIDGVTGALRNDANARHIVHCVNNMPKVVEALYKCVSELERNTCLHEETYRAGVLWEVCSHCGHKWADDEGGKPEFTENPVVEEVRTLLAALEAEKGGE